MDFRISTDQRELCAAVRAFAQKELGSEGTKTDGRAAIPLDEWNKCAEFGILGWPVPELYGGAALDPLSMALGLEALGYGCRDSGLVFAIGNQLWGCIIHIVTRGTDQQRESYLPRLCDGSLIGCQALTEDGAGSDVLSLATTARSMGDQYIIDGTKQFISNAPDAGLFIVFARTSSEKSQRGLTAFLVPADTPGLAIEGIAKMGLHSTPMGEVRLRGCSVPKESVLGRVGDGYDIFLAGMVWERIFMFAPQVGVMERLTEDAVAFAASRKQFNHPIGAYQAVAHRIADMRVRTETARMVLYQAAWLKQAGKLALLESTIAKLVVSEGLVASSLDMMQIYGARGYVEKFGVEQEVRDALAGRIYAGTSDIQRNIIATLIGVPTNE